MTEPDWTCLLNFKYGLCHEQQCVYCQQAKLVDTPRVVHSLMEASARLHAIQDYLGRKGYNDTVRQELHRLYDRLNAIAAEAVESELPSDPPIEYHNEGP